MRLRSYDQYKPSGVAWLGDFPTHWEVKRGRFAMRVNPASDRLLTLNPDAEVTFLPMEAVGEYGGLNLETTKLLSDIGSGYTEFQDGDVIVAKITPCFENGKGALASGLTNGVAFGTTELHVLRTGSRLNNKFLFYLTISSVYRKTGEAEMYGAGGQKRVPPEFNKNFPLLLPPLEEQCDIAGFLDCETARLDALVGKKRELIGKLREKRAALISRTVSRGLPPDDACAAGFNPHPKLRSSGIEWIGDVPMRWVMGRVSALFQFRSGGTPNTDIADYWNGDIPWVSAKDMKALRISDAEDHITSTAVSESATSIVPVGTVLIVARSGILRHTLPVAVALREVAINQDIKGLLPNKDQIVSLFFAYWVQGHQPALLTLWRQQGATVESLDFEKLKTAVLPLPPVREQSAIADFLNRETAVIDCMIEKVEAAIERLLEYRSALITAAVTGKIDVRDPVRQVPA